MNYKADLDPIDRRILQRLQDNARLSLSEIGRQVKLSQPAVAERVRRLEEEGFICGYHAAVDPGRLGFSILAFIRLTSTVTQSKAFLAKVPEMAEVIECHRITGSDCFILKVMASSVGHLETLIDELTAFGTPSTSIVLSSPLTRRTIAGPCHRLDSKPG